MMTSTTGRVRPISVWSPGFSLLELVVVMVIIATVLGIVSPSLRGFVASREINNTAEHVLSLTKLARTQAIAEGRLIRLNLDTVSKTYWLSIERRGIYEWLGNDFGRIFTLSNEVALLTDELAQEDGFFYVTFYPDGRTDVGTIILQDLTEDVIVLHNPSATEGYRVLSSDEASRL